MRKIRNGLILAGGDSTRFWPLEEKNLFSFLGKPLILYQVEELSHYCESITIVANQKNSLTIKRLLDNFEGNLKYQIVVQKDMNGQAGAILSVKNIIKGETLIINASDVVDYKILDKITSLNFETNKVVFFGKKMSEYFPGGYFKFEAEKVKSIVEKPDRNNMPSNILKLVMDYYSDIDLLIYALEKVSSKEDNLYEVAINKLLEKSINNKYFLYDGYLQGLKYPWHILQMMKIFLDKIKKSQISKAAVISKKAIIVGPVIIEDNVRIGDFVKITGPAYIGKNTIIGDYSLIRESQINEDCLIGSYSEIARSYIGNKVFLHRNYVGDSVLGDKAMMGAQAVTANLRFDSETIYSYIDEERIDTNMSKFGAIIGSEAKIGVNTTIVPGVKIGKKTWIAPHEIIKYDIEDNTYLEEGEEKINHNI